MAVTPLKRRNLAQHKAVNGAMHCVAMASVFALSVLPNAALAQTQLDLPTSDMCISAPMSRLDRMRSAQNSGQLADLNMTQNLQLSSDCSGMRDGAAAQTEMFKDAILGTQSVTIARTPFDRNWAAVQTRSSNARVKSALAKSGALAAADKVGQLQLVNRWVNGNIAFGEDQALYRRADYWAPASETLRRGAGDCEDFAIAKMDMLAALGIARADMRLIIARDLVRNADHAVLVVKLDSGSVMLDNVTDRLLDGQMPNDYRPIMSFSQNTKWMHGFDAQKSLHVRQAASPEAAETDVFAVTAELELPTVSTAWLSVPLVVPTTL